MKTYNFTFLEQELINALFRRDFGTALKIRKKSKVNLSGMDQEVLSKIACEFAFQGNYHGIYFLDWVGMDFSYINSIYDCEVWSIIPPHKVYYRFFKKLIDRGVIKPEGFGFSTLFHDAAICGDRRLLEFMIKKGADINSTFSGGWQCFTPLMRAAQNNHVSCVRVLLENGADIYIKDNVERTAVLEYPLSKEVRQVIEEHLKKQKV